MAPTYFRREPGIDAPTAIAAPHFRSSWCNPSQSKTPRQSCAARCSRGATHCRRSERHEAAETIATRTFPIAVPAGAIVSGFMPLKSEINPLPLMRRLAAAGASLALPVVVATRAAAVMRAYAFGDPLEARQWGIREPKPDAARSLSRYPPGSAPCLRPPRLSPRLRRRLLRHDARGAACQKIDRRRRHRLRRPGNRHVPTTPRDARLDLVLTEHGVIDFRIT